MKQIEQSPLLVANNLSLLANGVWSEDVDQKFAYSDGDGAENSLRQALLDVKDRSSLSLELEGKAHDWISEYHLSSERANIYRFLNLKSVVTGLELGAGCGAISRYLGELGICLDAVEGNNRRAEICRLRCEDLGNVQVIQANFNKIRLPEASYDAVFLNGVLEYAARFYPERKDDRDALLAILVRASSSLKDDGIVLIAIENRMGLKYWLGAREDHYGKVYKGLYGYPAGQGIRTYDRDEWDSILADFSGSGEYSHRFIYPFPDYKMARAVLSDRFIERYPFAHSNLYRMPSTDNGHVLHTDLHEFLLWQALQKSGCLQEYANSFFILLSRSRKKLDEVCDQDFMHFSGKGRKPYFRTVTRKPHDLPMVQKECPVGGQENRSSLLAHDLSSAEYITGPLLVSQWLNAAQDDDEAVFEGCLKRYYAFLQQYWADNPENNDAFDMLPFNIVIDESNEWHVIDKEWRVKIELSAEFLFFRALLWFPIGNENILENIIEKYKLSTRKDFIEYGFNLLSLSLTDKFDNFVALEEKVQAEIENQARSHPVKGMLIEPLRCDTASFQPAIFPVQLYWAEDEEQWSEERSLLVSGRMGSDSQTLTFQLPPLSGKTGRIRFDPADRGGFFHIYSLTVYVDKADTPSGNKQVVWRLEGADQICAASRQVNIHYCKNSLGSVFVAVSDDPHFILVVPDQVNKACKKYGKVWIEIQMDWPKSADFIIAMDSLGEKVARQEYALERLATVEKHSLEQADRISRQAVQLREKSDQVKTKEIYIGSLEAEIAAMKQTLLWRTAELFRSRIYYLLLDGKTLLQKSVRTVRQEGLKSFLRKARLAISANPSVASLGLVREDYDLWVRHHRLTEFDIAEIKKTISEFRVQPLMSIIVPVYNVDQVWLEKTIDSVRNQLYENWELCLCDDCSPEPHVKEVLKRYADADKRIKIFLKEKNEGIAITSNAALAMATGDYVGLLDHDDELSVDALYENVRVINDYPSAGLIYSDEDKLDMQGNRVDVFFKPDFSPELIYSQNYICHFSVIDKTILDEIGGFREGVDGSQDHDLILRVIEKTDRIHHIPKVLYHWRKIPGSTAAVYDSKSYAWEAGRKAIEDALARCHVKGTVSLAKYQGSYRVQREIINKPLISIVIPFKDKGDLLKNCILSILEKSSYSNFEIVGVSNNSTEKGTFKLMQILGDKDPRIRFLEYNVDFNFADICNYGVEQAKGDYIVLLNNDIEILTPEWIENMLCFAQDSPIGAVGAKLYYPDQRIQHAGIVIGMAGVAGHPHHFFHKDDVGYYARPHIIHNVSAVTGACLMVEKKLYQAAGGMDSEHLAVAYNDVDFCLKLLSKGYRNVFTPYSEMIHYESQSRGYEDTPEKFERLQRESDYFREKWAAFLEKGDPYYNVNLSCETENFAIKI